MKRILLTISMLLIMIVAFAQNQISELNKGLVFRWEGSEWNPTRDMVSGAQGTATATYPIAGRNGDGANRYYSFNGTSDYVTLPTIPAFGTGDFTIIAKINGNSFAGNRGIIGGATNSCSFVVNANGTLKIDKTIISTTGTSTGTISIDVLNTVVYSRSGTTGTFYINGVASGTCTDSENYSVAQTLLGVYGSGLNYFSGSISLVRIFNYALTPTQITNYSKPEYPIEWVDRGATGAELVTNGNFSSGTTGWTTQSGSDITVTSGEAVIGSGQYAQQLGMTILSGKKYLLKVDAYKSGTAASFLLSTINGLWLAGEINYYSSYPITESKTTYLFPFTATGSANGIMFKENYGGGYNMMLDNVSLTQLGCVLDLNPSGLSRASDGSYNTGYWTDRTNSITATVSGAVSVIPPASNLNATYLNGTTSYIGFTGNPTFGTGNFSVNVRFRISNSGGNLVGGANNSFGLQCYVGYGYRINRVGDTDGLYQNASGVLANEWNTLTYTRNGTVGKFYFNGVLQSTISDTYNYSGANNYIGKYDASSGYFSGFIYDVSFYNVCLSDDAVKLIYDTKH